MKKSKLLFFGLIVFVFTICLAVVGCEGMRECVNSCEHIGETGYQVDKCGKTFCTLSSSDKSSRCQCSGYWTP